jgi:hypothetical protein
LPLSKALYFSLVTELKLDWEVINGITGIIGAISALGSIGYISTRTKNDVVSNKVVSTYKFMSFLLSCSGWVLICFAYLWFFEPYGSYPASYEYQQFFGVLLSFPAVVLFGFGIKLMCSEKYNKPIKQD